MKTGIASCVVVLLLTACGGSGSSDTPPDLQGVWSGHYAFNGQITPLKGMIKDGGPGFFYRSDGVVLVMPHTGSSSQLDEPLVAYAPFARFFLGDQTKLDASLKANASSSDISGTLTFGGDLTNFAVKPLSPFKGTPSLVPGIWAGQYFGTGNVTLQVSESGAITGMDDLSCTFTGQITQPDPGENLFTVTLKSAGAGFYCGHRFSGLAYESDTDQLDIYANAPGTYYYIAVYDTEAAPAMELKVQ